MVSDWGIVFGPRKGSLFHYRSEISIFSQGSENKHLPRICHKIMYFLERLIGKKERSIVFLKAINYSHPSLFLILQGHFHKSEYFINKDIPYTPSI